MATKKIKGKTETGFAFSVDPSLLHNVEFLEGFAEVQNGDGLGVFRLIDQMLGKEQKQALYEHIRGEDGIVQVEDLTAELTNIFDALAEADETKN